jgi:hypothetical protein
LPRQVDDPVRDGPSGGRRSPPYAQPHLGRSVLDIATSVGPYLALSVLMYLALDISYLLVLVIAVPAAGFLVRTYILFHDCTHGSLLRPVFRTSAAALSTGRASGRAPNETSGAARALVSAP